MRLGCPRPGHPHKESHDKNHCVIRPRTRRDEAASGHEVLPHIAILNTAIAVHTQAVRWNMSPVIERFAPLHTQDRPPCKQAGPRQQFNSQRNYCCDLDFPIRFILIFFDQKISLMFVRLALSPAARRWALYSSTRRKINSKSRACPTE